VSGNNQNTMLCTNAAGCAVTIPLSLPTNPPFQCALVQMGAGAVTPIAASGVTLLPNPHGFTKSSGVNALISLIQVATNSYILAGDGA